MIETSTAQPRSLSELDAKANAIFPSLVVRKDLPGRVRGNAVVPGYVLEFLLAQFCASDDEDTIERGIEAVRDVLAKHYVHRGEAELVKSTIRDRGRHRVIDKVTVVLDDRRDMHTATFANLGLRAIPIDDATVKRNPKLLTGGVWCRVDLEYTPGDADEGRWFIAGLQPIQLGQFDMAEYLTRRAEFGTDEWIDLLMQTIGFAPERLSHRAKLMQLVRLIPFVERNYNLVELGPKGTGKSHIYSEFSPHGMLISGGEVTVPKLFVNNSSGQIGLVGYWDVVAFDEFAGQKRVDKSLVDIMKNYMANKTFSRGVETIGADASMVFIGNTSRPVPAMLAHSDLFEVLPPAYHDSAYLDRLHHYLPGWEVEIIRRELFTDGYGFVVDYLAEALAHLRTLDFSDAYAPHFTLSEEISTRDRDGVRKTFSGLMKLVFPHRGATAQEIEHLLAFAIEGRKRVKDQILRIDHTMDQVRFGYADAAGTWHDIQTQEELDYPQYFGHGETDTDGLVPPPTPTPSPADTAVTESPLRTGLLDIRENTLGQSYRSLLIPHLRGATVIDIVDPYIRQTHQLRNLFELLCEVVAAKSEETEIRVRLTTVEETKNAEVQILQLAGLSEIQAVMQEAGVEFTCEFGDPKSEHDRWIETDTGWRIQLGRGLDIFEQFGRGFDLRAQLPERRRTKKFTVTYLRTDAGQ
ncbi:BREX system Lon protease-like protein BrxL [Nocardia sp. CA-128927]|uniref:BREX system Lon protease-like protein BrxL n=1 Tax=Nocardia sp. CA-128927 TaxID=3239975 RepID=UPI003D997786